MDEIGLMFFVARWADPLTGHFVQADTIVPSAGNVKDFNRYAYGRYNPLVYVDPSGHAACRTKEDCADAGMSPAGKDLITLTPVVYANIVYKEFGWKVDKNFSMPEMQNIFVTGWQIKTFVDSFTDGKGQDWMQNNLSGIHMHKGGLPHHIVSMGSGPTSVVFLKNSIWFADISATSLRVHIAHEIAHVYDNRSRRKGLNPPIWSGGGHSDALIRVAGGIPSGIRWRNGDCGIANTFKWSSEVMGGYGNTSSADYFAEAFAWTIFDQSKMPDRLITYWIIGRILMDGQP